LDRLEKRYEPRAPTTPPTGAARSGASATAWYFPAFEYGREEDARKMIVKTVRPYSCGLEKYGFLHENDKPDRCEPIAIHGIQNRNFLALNMTAWPKGKKYVDTFQKIGRINKVRRPLLQRRCTFLIGVHRAAV
jgi:hypothetical protein